MKQLVSYQFILQATAMEYDLRYVEVSAKTGDGVKAMFEALPNRIIENENKALSPDHITHVVSTARNASEKRSCCNIC